MYNDDEKKVHVQKVERRESHEEESDDFISRFFNVNSKRLLTDADKMFDKIMWMDILISVILVLVGVIFLLHPDISVNVLSVLFGIAVVAFGVLNLYAYKERHMIPLFRFHLVYGVLAIIIGILTIMNPFSFSQVVTLFVGFWMLYLALTKIDFSIRLKTIHERSWLIILVSALLEIFMSVVIFINPFSNLLITQVAGAYFVLCGILNIMDAVLTRKREIDFLDQF